MTYLRMLLFPQSIASIMCVQGDEGDRLYIVESGVCAVQGQSGQELALLTPTMFFGELALLRNEVR